MKKAMISSLLTLSLVSFLTGCECPFCDKSDTAKKSVATKNPGIHVSKALNDKKSFEDAIADKKLSIIKFWASWCGACITYAPNFQAVADELKDKYNFYSVDVDQIPDVPGKYGISGIPATLFFKDGKKIANLVGAVSQEQLKNKIEEANK